MIRQVDALRRRVEIRRSRGLKVQPVTPQQERDAAHQIDALRRCAAIQFGELNGWQATYRGFRADTLARGGCHDSCNWGDPPQPNALFDHPVYFREIARPYRSAAIVGQPYATDLETAQRLAAELGLVVHAPTFLTASWWAPGRTRLFCVTRPDVTQVQFLDDQTYWEW